MESFLLRLAYQHQATFASLGRGNLVIEQYNFGEMVIAGKRYTTDLIMWNDGIKQNWWRKEGHLLQLEDIEKDLEKVMPEIVIAIPVAWFVNRIIEAQVCIIVIDEFLVSRFA